MLPQIAPISQSDGFRNFDGVGFDKVSIAIGFGEHVYLEGKLLQIPIHQASHYYLSNLYTQVRDCIHQ